MTCQLQSILHPEPSSWWSIRHCPFIHWSIHQLYSFHFPLQIREISIRHSIVTSWCFGGNFAEKLEAEQLMKLPPAIWSSCTIDPWQHPAAKDWIKIHRIWNGEIQLELECLLICNIILGLLQAFTMVCQYVSYSAILFVWCFLGVFLSCCFPFVLNPCDAVKLSIPRFQWIHSQHNLHKLFCHASCMPRSHLLLKSCDLGRDDRFTSTWGQNKHYECCNDMFGRGWLRA